MCERCRERHRRNQADARRQQGQRQITLSDPYLISEPDPQVVVTLRQALAEYRARGWPFRMAWGIAVAFALEQTSGQQEWERRSWARVLNETRPYWAAAYHGQLAPMRLTAGVDSDDLASHSAIG